MTLTGHQLLIAALLIAGIAILAYGALASFGLVGSATAQEAGCRTGALGLLFIVLAIIVAVGGLF